MNFNNEDLMIKEAICSFCEDRIRRRNDDLQPEYWKDKQGRLKKEYHDEYWSWWETKFTKEICLVIGNDIGGDKMALCIYHLSKIIKEIKKAMCKE